MAKNKDKVFSKVAETAKESDMMRMRRIDGSQNGATLRTRVVRDKTKYNRNLKHKKSLAFCYGLKSLADAGDFPFYGALTPSIRLLRRRRNQYSIRLALRNQR
jgi:hypothetical protein